MKHPLLLLSISAICLAQPATADPASINNLFLPLLLDPKTGKVKMEYREKWNPLSPMK